MRPVDPRLLRHAKAARGHLLTVVILGLATSALVLAQAGLLAGAARGHGLAAFWPVLMPLAGVMLARALVSYGGKLQRCAPARRSRASCAAASPPTFCGSARSGSVASRRGEIAILATRGLDALGPYVASYLPQLALACWCPSPCWPGWPSRIRSCSG
jgi:ABC-type transport system involved in cytochrome bd biosynthesis fused ATPase/permease subunit